MKVGKDQASLRGVCLSVCLSFMIFFHHCHHHPHFLFYYLGLIFITFLPPVCSGSSLPAHSLVALFCFHRPCLTPSHPWALWIGVTGQEMGPAPSHGCCPVFRKGGWRSLPGPQQPPSLSMKLWLILGPRIKVRECTQQR